MGISRLFTGELIDGRLRHTNGIATAILAKRKVCPLFFPRNAEAAIITYPVGSTTLFRLTKAIRDYANPKPC
jgi:hypothetical protein